MDSVTDLSSCDPGCVSGIHTRDSFSRTARTAHYVPRDGIGSASAVYCYTLTLCPRHSVHAAGVRPEGVNSVIASLGRDRQARDEERDNESECRTKFAGSPEHRLIINT
jgi:hypothetical protein